jgi:hypothetical protein
MAFHATFTPSRESEVPLHKKVVRMLSIFLMVAQGRMKIDDQYTWIDTTKKWNC